MTVPIPDVSFPYRNLEKVGEGAMGVVYRAVEVGLERPVAIKFLKPDVLERSDPEEQEEMRNRFIQEARAAAALTHPGITTVYRIGVHEAIPFIAMEWLEGETMQAFLRREAPLAIDRAAALTIELLETLQAAHDVGIVHRDIKPSNLVLLRSGSLKITDFGIASVRDSNLVKTRAGHVMATPQYAAPEQLYGHPVDGRTDIYAAGIFLYMALTRRLPFRGETLAALVTEILHGTPLPPSRVNDAIMPGLEAIILRSLARDPKDRFAQATDMADALRPFATTATSQDSATGTWSGWSDYLPSLVEMQPATHPMVFALPRDPWQMVQAFLDGWPAVDAPPQPRDVLIRRLLEQPLHAAPFCGALRAGQQLVFLCGGSIVGAYDVETLASGDEVVESLPEQVTARLLSRPEDLPFGTTRKLAALPTSGTGERPPYDSSFVDIGKMIATLERDAFDGIMRLARGEDQGFVLFHEGRPSLALFSEGWDGSATNVVQVIRKAGPTKIYLREELPPPLSVTTRWRLESLALSVEMLDAGDGPLRRVEMAVEDLPEGVASRDELDALLSIDPAYRFLGWMMSTLPGMMKERSEDKHWPYLVGWVDLVHRALLHRTFTDEDLDQPLHFDIATKDKKNKVLHLVRRRHRATPESLARFVEEVIALKKARVKRGDVGAAIFVAPTFDGDTLDSYRNLFEGGAGRGSGWTFKRRETLTQYHGFVRLSARRGFHLLLVTEDERGYTPHLV